MKVTRLLAVLGGAAVMAAVIAPPTAFANGDLSGAVSQAVTDAAALVPADDPAPTDEPTATPDPEPTTEAPDPEPDPEPTTEAPNPAPTTETPDPEPTTPTPDPEPTVGTTVPASSPTTPSTPRPTTPKPSPTTSSPPKAAKDAAMTLAVSSAVSDVTKDKLVGAGDLLQFTYSVRNTGEVTLSQVSVSGSTGSVSCPATSVAVGATMACTSHLTLTQAQVDAGSVQSSAAASAQSPTGNEIDATRSLTAKVTGLGRLGSSLRLTPVNGGSTVAKDGSLRASASLVNSGTLTLRSVAVVDSTLKSRGISFSCGRTTLAPGQATTCVTSSFKPTTYQKSQKVAKSNAQACATTLAGAKVCGADLSASVKVDSGKGNGDEPVKHAPAKLSLWQRVVAVNDINEDDELDFKDGLQYAFGVTNSGGVTVRSIAVRDGMLSRVGVSVRCPYTVLDPGQSMVCRSTGFYPLTKYQAMEGKITNYAVAVGLRPNGTQVSSNTSVDVHGKAAVVDSVAFGALAFTGSDNTVLSSVAAALVLLGVAMVWLRRQERLQVVISTVRRLRR